jgi:uncharacterized protein involved in exopolysaccharide biosynthesis
MTGTLRARDAVQTPEIAAPKPLSNRDIGLTLATHARLLVAVPLVVGALMAIASLLTRNRYTASTALVAETRSASLSTQLASIAALAGVSVGGTSAAQSPQFYTALLRSRDIQYALLRRNFSTEGLGPAWAGRDSATLLDLLEVRGNTPALRLFYGAKKLDKSTAVGSDIKTSIIRLSFTSTSPTLAAAVANAYTDELNRFNQGKRQLQAGARRRFVEERVETTARDLAAAETEVRDFLSRNRQFQNSPSLAFEYQRLQRAVTLQQDLYLDLRRQLDAARIAEVDDTPTLTTIEPAIPPQLKSWPSRKAWVLGAVLGAFAALATILVLVDHRATLMPGLIEMYDAAATRFRRPTPSTR